MAEKKRTTLRGLGYEPAGGTDQRPQHEPELDVDEHAPPSDEDARNTEPKISRPTHMVRPGEYSFVLRKKEYVSLRR